MLIAVLPLTFDYSVAQPILLRIREGPSCAKGCEFFETQGAINEEARKSDHKQ